MNNRDRLNSTAKAQQKKRKGGEMEVVSQWSAANGHDKKPFRGGGFSVNGSLCPAIIRKPFQTPIPASLREKLEPSPASNLPIKSSPNNSQPTPTVDTSNSQQLLPQKSSTIETVFCQPSELQKQLYNEVDYLMTLKKDEQEKLLKLVCNHPILCYHRIMELSAELNHSNSSKKAKKEYVNYSIVTRHFPIRFDRSQCWIEDSGKLVKLFEMVTEKPVPKLIISSNYVKTLDLLEQLFSRLTLQFAIFRINANIPATAMQLHLAQIMEPEPEGKCKIILLSTKADRLSPALFDMARLIFYDPEKADKSLDQWKTEGRVDQVYMLITNGTCEAEECSPSNNGKDEDGCSL